MAVSEGTADLAPFLWPETSVQLAPPDGVRVVSSPSGYVETLLFNLDPRYGHSALQDAQVRAALAHIVDRQQMCQALSAGQTAPAATLLSGTIFENPSLQPPPALPEEAIHLLESAGWVDSNGDGIRDREGINLALRYAIPSRDPQRTTVQSMLESLGVGIYSVPPGPPEPWDNPAGWDLAQWAEQPAGYPDPDDPRWLCAEAQPGGHNPSGVCDEELDQLIIAQANAVDPDERIGLLFQLHEWAGQQAWWIPLCRWDDLWAIRDELTGPRPWRGAPLWNAWEWTLNR
jgi:peptide/nickel transport system substrate-binding protein